MKDAQKCSPQMYSDIYHQSASTLADGRSCSRLSRLAEKEVRHSDDGSFSLKEGNSWANDVVGSPIL